MEARRLFRRTLSGVPLPLLVPLTAVGLAALLGAVAGVGEVTAAMLFAAGAIVAFESPAAVAALAAAFLPVGFSVTEVHGSQVGLLDALLWGMAAGYAVRTWRRRERLQPTAAELALLIFVVGVAIGGTSAANKGLWLHELARWAALAIVFRCGSRALRDSLPRDLFYVGLGVAAAVESTYAIGQFVSAAGSRFSRLGGAIIYPQPQATLQHPNALGAFLAIAAFVLAGRALAATGRSRWAWASLVVLTTAGAVVPFSRGAWLSIAVGAVTLVAADRRHRRALAAALSVVAVAAGAAAAFDNGALGARLRSLFHGNLGDLNGFRLTLVREAADAIAHHPLNGAGRFAEFGIYAGRRTLATHPHDLLLGIGVFYGVPAMLAFAALLVICIRSAWRARRSATQAISAEAAGVVAALVALLCDGLLEYPFWNTTWTAETMLVLMLGAALGWANNPQDSPAVTANRGFRTDSEGRAAIQTQTTPPQPSARYGRL